MLIIVWVRMHGGIWRFREGLGSGRGRRLRVAVYKRYLENLGGYISLLATFDGPPTFPHKPMGVFIAPNARLGKEVTIYQQVTIGKNDIPGHRLEGSPTIGNGVYIGAGARIIGRITIGDGARIGAGAIVVKDVPAGATAVSPAAVLVPPGR